MIMENKLPTNRLLVYECQMGAYKRLQKNRMSVEDLDNLTNRKITQMEYMVIFLNDQMYNTSLVIEDVLRKNGKYRHKEKMLCNEIKKEIGKYNNRLDNWSREFITLIADVTSSLEEDIKPSLDIYSYQISQALLDHGVSGVNNQIMTQVHQLFVLNRMAVSVLDGIQDMYFKHTACYYPSLFQLEIKNLDRLSSELFGISAKTLKDKDIVVDLSANKMVTAAFDVVLKKIWDTKFYDKAFENWS